MRNVTLLALTLWSVVVHIPFSLVNPPPHDQHKDKLWRQCPKVKTGARQDVGKKGKRDLVVPRARMWVKMVCKHCSVFKHIRQVGRRTHSAVMQRWMI
jgi:hypothetical protein